ncbi:MAG: hypothetical protein KIC63_04125 [Clostridium sp.]|nr:hypothetical protein [Clostridium sp.]
MLLAEDDRRLQTIIRDYFQAKGQAVVCADDGEQALTAFGQEVFDAVLKLLPLDTYEKPLYLMEKVPGDNVETPIWDEYRDIAKKYTDAEFGGIERFAFYERAKSAYAVISTGEEALYANILLKKGVVTD